MPTIEEVLNRSTRLLKILEKEPGLSITEIAERLGTTRNTASNLVDALVKFGWVEKKLVGGAPRKVAVFLTDTGYCIVRCISAEKQKS